MNRSIFMLNNKTKLLIIFLIVVIILMAILVFFKSENQPLKQTPVPIIKPSPSPTFTPSSGGPLPDHTYSYSSEADIQARQQGENVSQLIKKLPYKGTNFTLSYSFSTNRFTLILKKGQEAAGNQEFDTFLKSNEIQDRSWIKDLTTTSI